MLDDIEKMLRATVDKLRANIDAVEYKQVALGLVLLQGWGPRQKDRDQSLRFPHVFMQAGLADQAEMARVFADTG